MQNDYYKEYYDLERKHWWFVAREKIIVNYIKKMIKQKFLNSDDLKILNVGCGPGRSSQYLASFGEVTSIEHDKECCEFASEKTGLTIINGSITDLPFQAESFDLVCAFDVIEHVEDDQLAITEMKRVAKNEGILLITVPAFMGVWSHHDVINHHFRRYKLPQIRKLFLKDNNGLMIFSSYFNTFLFPPIYFFRIISNWFNSGEKRNGSGSDSTVAAGIMFAADSSAKVLSMSLGGNNDSASIRTAINYAIAQGKVVVAAMGNSALTGNPISYPAAYAGVIAVGANDNADQRGTFSQYGSHISVSAPGVNIYSTLRGNRYAPMSGTSMACPAVAGLAALILGYKPNLTAVQVKSAIQNGTDDLGSIGFDPYFGSGRINVQKTLSAL